MMTDRNIDGGKLWSITTLNANILNNSSVYFSIDVGDKPVKFSSRYFTTDLSSVNTWIYENLGYSGGTIYNPVNRNRILYDRQPSFVIKSGITPLEVINDTNDIRVLSAIEYNATNQTLINQIVEGEDFKWLFKPNTTYMVRIENSSGANGSFSSSTTLEELIWSN